MDAEHLTTSRDTHGVDVVGPTPGDQPWQAERATCPVGHASVTWQPTRDQRGQPISNSAFARTACQACLPRPSCTRAERTPRWLTVRPHDQHVALQAALQRQGTAAFKERYAARAGIEGTLSQGTRAFGLRRARYSGLVKTHLQHILTAVAINITRLAAWVEESPRAPSRQSPFARLAPAA